MSKCKPQPHCFASGDARRHASSAAKNAAHSSSPRRASPSGGIAPVLAFTGGSPWPLDALLAARL